jgi:hypothetical protein
MGLFSDVPMPDFDKDGDETKTLSGMETTIDGRPALCETWRNDDGWGRSVIFRTSDVEALKDEDIESSIRRHIKELETVEMNVSRGKEFTFVNSVADDLTDLENERMDDVLKKAVDAAVEEDERMDDVLKNAVDAEMEEDV